MICVRALVFCSEEAAKKCFLIMDKDGALTSNRQSQLNKEQRIFMRDDVPAGMYTCVYLFVL